MTRPDPGRTAGSVVMAGFEGATAAGAARALRDVEELGLGGVILFERNVAGPEALRALVRALQEAAGGGLTVAVDQEGGEVARLHPGNGFPQFPSHAACGAARDPAFTRGTAARIAACLAGAGISVNLAPVVDLDPGPGDPLLGARGRCFAPDPASVAAQARAFLEGHREHGVACALKHFPGHGCARDDPHDRPVDVTTTHRPEELEPFFELARAGGGRARAELVLVGHLLHRGVDPALPASLSAAWIEGTLRREIGFEGVVVSDDLDMGAVARIPLEERVALALEAGVDLLLFGNRLSHDPEGPQRAVAAVRRAVRSGRISPGRLERSRARLARLREGARPGG